MDLTEKIRQLLTENNIDFSEVDHGPAKTCEESAQERGEDLKIGGKTLLLKDKTKFHLFVLAASLQADSNKIRKVLKTQRLRFASAQELSYLANVEKGALPPFGRPILPLDLYVDESITQNKKIAFNAGLLTKSFILKINDYLKIANPIICHFSK
mgnify:CR=1 FL=1